jgi:hypothetical protein
MPSKPTPDAPVLRDALIAAALPDRQVRMPKGVRAISGIAPVTVAMEQREPDEDGPGRRDGRCVLSAMRNTILVSPNTLLTVAFDVNYPGKWAFHCHNLSHLGVGMITMTLHEPV